MPTDRKIHHSFKNKPFQVKVRGTVLYYYLYDEHGTEITSVGVNLEAKTVYVNHCIQGMLLYTRYVIVYNYKVRGLLVLQAYKPKL